MPKVSIVVSIYNVEKYVRKTIESVLNQTEKEIEIILVDDGSTDSSGIICDEYANKDKRIKVIHKKNGGLSSARNAGIKISSSNYVMLLDGDDCLVENAISILVEVIRENPSDIIQFHYKEVEENEIVQLESIEQEIYRLSTKHEIFENLYKFGGEAASACTKLFKRDLLLEVPFIAIQHEDEMWCTQAFQKQLTITYISNVLYLYMMRENSIIHSSFNERKLDVFTVIQERIKTLKELNLTYLLHFEYERMFNTVLRLYCEAKDVKDKNALSKLKYEFTQYKNDIKAFACLSTKFNMILKLMSINYGFIEIYRIYWKYYKKI